ncbi:MAG TPA: hypothetical protein VNT30_04750 [Stellaceae bacterium]|nr:hypothetical protein [Stellaceae bacterium]
MHLRYTLFLVGCAGLLVLAAGFFGRGLEPLYGDLTRIGWYSENDFGWHLPKERFAPLAAELGRLDGRYDVVAIGDSFTGEDPHRSGTTWPNYLAQMTKARVAIFDSDEDLIGRLIDSDAFRDHPPAVVVYEIVERQLVAKHRGAPDGACPTGQAPLAVTLSPPPVDRMMPVPTPFMRPMTRSWDELPVSYGLDYLWQNLRRWVTGVNTTSAVRLELTRGGMFSSRADRSLLVYGEDFNKLAWSEADWRGAACALLRLQQRVQANGKTVFLAMVPPDKLTVYGPFLELAEFRGISRLDLLAATPGLNLVDLMPVLDPTSQVDLYLPDDTHWSTIGQALAARTVLETLQQRGVFAGP